ncbi:SRPBCC family protein [Streptomyces sp. NPDC050560]|uniref:SRPBCC family protein n=1 Tax=Streptomyces sp. NPDC050560 TaxID=3365630 RepID=UPI0037A2A2D6
MIKIDEEIAVPAPPPRVWEVVSDPAEVVSCIDGAALGASHDDGSFDGTLAVKFGAIRVRFGARVSLDLDEAEQEGRLSARGRDGQGATRFSAHATFEVREDGAGGTRVRVSGEINLAGRLASVIEAGAGAVVGRMTRDFTGELVRRCTGDTAQAATGTAARATAQETGAPVRPSRWARLRARLRRVFRGRRRDGAPDGRAA